MSDLAGQTLGQYEIIRLIGRGGMASVYLARQRSIGRMVAVKVLPHHLMAEETFLKRFQREVQAVALMQHPRIIPVHDYGEENGMPYIVMAYIEGGSLAQRIQENGPLPLDETVRLVGQIAEGLDYAHKQGVIHRDFKPSNVLLDKNDNAYLSDFGIAKVSQETAQLTGSGIVGTPTYMAPEMFKQEMATPAVDIYALGVTLYQMLCGVTPYEGTTPVQLMYSHLNEPVPSIEAAREGVPPAVQIVLDRAMAKAAAERYATAGQLAEALRRTVEGASPDTMAGVSMPSPAKTAPSTPTNAVIGPQPEVAETPAPEVAKKRGWFVRNWRILLSVLILLLTLFGLARGGHPIPLMLALAGILLLVGFHLSKREWWWLLVWLAVPICGVLAAMAETPGLVILVSGGLAIAGLVIEIVTTRKEQKSLRTEAH